MQTALTLLLAAGAVGILSYKLLPKPCEDLCLQGEELHLNQDFFHSQILGTYPRLSQYPLHLFVFVDLKRDCMADLFEYEQWIAAPSAYDFFEVTLFIPADNSTDILHSFQESTNLTDEQIILFGSSDPAAILRKFGLTKVLYSQINQVEWIRRAEENRSGQDRLGQSLFERAQRMDRALFAPDASKP